MICCRCLNISDKCLTKLGEGLCKLQQARSLALNFDKLVKSILYATFDLFHLFFLFMKSRLILTLVARKYLIMV